MPSRNPKVRAIEVEASKRAAADGKTSKAERFAIRNDLRAAEGLRPEERQRGGAAGVWDRNKQFAPALAALALPFALPAIGGLLGVGGAAGAGAAGAGTAAGTAAAASSPFSLASLGGIASKVGSAIKSPLGQTALAGLQGVSAANQRRKANATMEAQLARENALYAQTAPLRLSGIEGMLHPAAPNLSNLDDLQRRASNYAGNLSAPLPLGGR